MIEKYSFGKIVVNGAAYANDIKIVQGRVIPDWWRKKGHSISISIRGFQLLPKVITIQSPDSRHKNPNTSQSDI